MPHLELNPGTALAFQRPLTRVINRPLELTNVTDAPVAFKVKTTSPKVYCVKPNSGRLEARSSLTIQVILQPFKEEPAPSFKCRDKFLVQSCAITVEGESMPLTELWNTMGKEMIQEQKIRCVIVGESPAAAAPSSLAKENETAMTDDMTENTQSHISALDTSHMTSRLHEMDISDPSPFAQTQRSSPPPAIEGSPIYQRQPALEPVVEKPIAEKISQEELQPVIAPVAAAVPSEEKSEHDPALESLRSQLATAAREIRRLRAELESAQVLRQRTNASDKKETDLATAGTQTGQKQLASIPPAEGVPLQVVLALCGVVFLTTWIFF